MAPTLKFSLHFSTVMLLREGMSNSSQNLLQSASNKADWSEERKKTLILICRDEVLSGDVFTDNGFSKQFYTKVLQKFNCQAGVNYSKTQLQSQLNLLKEKFTIFADLRDQSGFGWDEVTQRVTAAPEVWDRYISSHPKASVFRYNTLPYWRELEEIFAGRYATGKYALSTAPSALPPLYISGALQEESDSEASEASSRVGGGRRFSTAGQRINHEAAVATITASGGGGGGGSTAAGRSAAVGPSSAPSSEKKRKRSLADDRQEFFQVFREVAANASGSKQQRTPPPAWKPAVEYFANNCSQNLSPRVRFFVKRQLMENAEEAKLFMLLDEEEKEVYLRSLLKIIDDA